MAQENSSDEMSFDFLLTLQTVVDALRLELEPTSAKNWSGI
jgi:hypothetical protein